MSECRDSVTDFFQEDHRRLDEALQGFRRSSDAGDGDAIDLLDQFAAGLRRHIAWEEGHLFPLFEEHTGMVIGGPTQVMRREHRRIEQILGDIREAFQQGARWILSQRWEDLLELLGAHNTKEEQVLYPSIDNLLDAAACRELFGRIRAEA